MFSGKRNGCHTCPVPTKGQGHAALGTGVTVGRIRNCDFSDLKNHSTETIHLAPLIEQTDRENCDRWMKYRK